MKGFNDLFKKSECRILVEDTTSISFIDKRHGDVYKLKSHVDRLESSTYLIVNVNDCIL
jgi:hypothetical protein